MLRYVIGIVAGFAGAGVIWVGLFLASFGILDTHGDRTVTAWYQIKQEVAGTKSGAKKIVFVRYPKGEGCQQNLIQNNPPLATAETWIVSDRGDDDLRLLRAAPDRVPYLFDAKTFTMRRFPSGAHAPDETDARHAPD